MLERLLARWKQDRDFAPTITAWRTLPARQPRFEPLPAALHPSLAGWLKAQGISALYSHQSQAWVQATRGENVVVVTATASGKSLCYNLPVLQTLLEQPAARALYLFPTKALAQDQAAALQRPPDTAEWPACGIYDGDTPANGRAAIRSQARIVLSNPDMLHSGILPRHNAWDVFFAGLQFVVLDEMHTFRGVFGSHVANVLRRLKRVAAHYGAQPQFILTTATIGNPGELAEKMIEAPARVIDDDGSGLGEKHFIVVNPPLVNEKLGLRRSPLAECERLAGDLIEEGVQTICFASTRRSVEHLVRNLLHASGETPGSQRVRGYRSGYLPGQRREIEAGLRRGAVQIVAATNALELGINIGGMGAALLAGYPGAMASLWQQAGRAGRGQEPSLAVLIAGGNPLDQYFARNPDYLFARPVEQALINPDHLLILLAHLRCAAYELPFKENQLFGNAPPPTVHALLDFLAGEGFLHRGGAQYFWASEQYPAQDVSLRSASPASITLHAGNSTIGEVDSASAAWMTHPGAIYLQEGQSYLVTSLDLEARQALLEPVEVDYFTEAASEVTITLETLRASAPAPGGQKFFGDIAVTSQVTGYRKIRWATRETLGMVALDSPPNTLQTSGYWVALDDDTVNRLQAEGLWSNAANDYGPGWPRLAAAVRARDGYRCQGCGSPEQGRAHDVHHLTPFRMFASAAQANRMENLATLCPACHRRAEAQVRVRSGLAGLAFALSNLAPLFLMCDGRDLGVHSDAQSPLAEAKPAIVIYDRAPAGLGFSERLFEWHDALLRRAAELVRGCQCEAGCPSCVGPGGEGGSGGKRESLAILDALTRAETSPDG